MLLLVALAGCETARPELADGSSARSPKLATADTSRPSGPARLTRFRKAEIQVRQLRTTVVHRKLPTVVPRPRERIELAVAEVPDRPEDKRQAAEGAELVTARFEWPVEGKILLGFGPNGGGERNDGINIEAEPGTPIHAAAAGEVSYAGKLKGFGNLILIRHDSGYITAYAHAQALLVSAGDRVDRGDVVGLSGRSGDVSRPQLHFEIRRGVKPLDPKRLLMTAGES